MKLSPAYRHRRSIRLKGYDYTDSGAYSVTVCTHNRECLFGEIVDVKMQLNNFGIIASRCWEEIPTHFDNVSLDVYVVMPNHLHGIIVLKEMPVGEGSPHPYGQKRTSLGRVVAYFKYQSTKHFNEILATPGSPVWQRNYYEHIIRDESDWNKIREYIGNNPVRWEEDENHPAKMRANT
jgi:REP element-mobilizing transposase RayT